jgi:peptidyl-prolyl cis-trans isomerase C
VQGTLRGPIPEKEVNSHGSKRGSRYDENMRFSALPLLALPMLCAVALAQPPAPTSTPVPVTKPAAAGAAVPAGDPVVFQVGDDKMTRSQFDQFVDKLPDNLKKEVQQNGKRKLAERLVELKVLSQEAKREKLDQKAEIKQQLALQMDNVLASALFQSIMQSAKPDAAALQKYYDDHKGEYEKVKARHILIRFKGSRVPLKPDQKDLTEEEALEKAKALRVRIVGGADFAVVAKAESDDTGSGANGGDLGSFARGSMVPQFEEAVFALAPGTVSEPVKTPFGWHLIQVQEHKTESLPEVQGAIQQKLAPEAAAKAIEQLKLKATITLDEAYFGPATPAPPPALQAK